MAENVLASKKKLTVVLVILVALMVLLLLRVGYWNVIEGENLQAQAETQWISDSAVEARRGSILDRSFNVLAQSAVSDTLVFIPQQIKDPDAVADAVSVILDLPRSEVLYKAATKTRVNEQGEEKAIGEVWVKRQITNEQAAQIEQLELAGVKLISDVKRYYPSKELASQIIGYTTLDGEGQTGIERRYNSVLEGRQGRMVAETDKLNNDIPNGQEMFIEPVDGQNVVLTIDEVMQNFLESVCREGMQNLDMDSAQGLIVDVTTGEIMGMANVPDFDLNDPPRSDGEVLSELSANIVTASSFEPGSIFTAFTAAAAMDAGMAEQQYECRGVQEWHGEEIMCSSMHGVQAFDEAVANGCLVAASQMADSLGKQTYYDYLGKFGFGEKTGIDYTTDTAGDVMGIKYASELDIAKMGAGDELKVSQLQLANAAASLLNGGTLYVPQLVLGLSEGQEGMTEVFGSQVAGQSVSAETASAMRRIFQDNVAAGDAQAAKLDEYTSGALYGVVDKYNSDGGLEIGKKIAVFMEYAPAENPRYLVMVTFNGIDEAQADMAGAPYTKAILKEILKYSYVQPDGGFGSVQATETEQPDGAELAEIPNVVDMGMGAAVEAIEAVGFTYATDGAGTVLEQEPAAGTQAAKGTEIRLTMDHKVTQQDDSTDGQEAGESAGSVETITVPDFSGMTMRQAMDLAISSGLRFYAQGDGIARTQYPVYGTNVQKGSSVVVTFKLDVAGS